MAPEKSAIFYIPTFSTVNRQSSAVRNFPLIFRQHESIHLQILFHPATIQTNRRHPIFLTIPARLHDHLVSRKPPRTTRLSGSPPPTNDFVPPE